MTGRRIGIPSGRCGLDDDPVGLRSVSGAEPAAEDVVGPALVEQDERHHHGRHDGVTCSAYGDAAAPAIVRSYAGEVLETITRGKSSPNSDGVGRVLTVVSRPFGIRGEVRQARGPV